MRIKDLELVGFKSFVDKTRFTFDDGISSIVGPNGCGKSNIVDAIRWVMGEMSAKSLRGGEMQDVIFNGSDTRKPMGMAQVSVIFSCEDGITPSGYEGMSEIQVTRRLYRSGESEYLINKRVCRLKDIVDLFLDTGIGSRAYSIIEQGQIAKVISAKPLERRILIEEAAGISKYRVKREEALRKIEATQTNLARVSDVIFEIKRTLTSLQRQAAKAERYHELKAELQELDVELAGREKVLLARQAEQTLANIKHLGDMQLQATTQLEVEETQLTKLRLDVLEHEKAINLAAEKVARLRETVRADESQRDLLSRDIEHLEAQIGLWREEIEAARERMGLMDQEVAATVEKIADLQTAATEARATLARNQEILQGAQARRQDLDRVAESARNELLRLAGRQASLRQAVQNHQDNRAARQRQIEQNQARAAANEELLGKTLADGEALRAKLAALQEERGKLESDLGDKRTRLANIRQTAEGKKKAFNEAKEAHDKTRVRLESLEEMRRNLEGYQYGVRKIMEAVRQGSGGLNGTRKEILGVLAEKISVPARFETALEAVLGERLQAVLVTDQEAGHTAADYLKTEKAGRGSFVPLEPRLPAKIDYPEKTIGQTLGCLVNHVELEPEYRQVAEVLLANVLVVENLDAAIRLHKENGYTGSFVTLDGELVDDTGTITGGQVDAVTSGILQKKREIAELSAKAEELAALLKKAEGDYYASEGMISRLQEVIAQNQQALDDNRIALSETAGESRRRQQEIERLQTEKAGLQQQAARLAEELAELEKRHAAEERELGEVDQALAAARHAADEKTAAQKALASEIDSHQKAVTESLLAVNNLRQETHNTENYRANRLHAKDEAAALVARRNEQVEQARETQLRHREKIAVFTQSIGEKITHLEAAEREAVQVREGVDEKIARVNQSENVIKMLRRDLESHAREIHSAELTASQIAMKREHVAERLREKYQIELDTLPEPADEAEMDTEALRNRAQEINQRIQQMGEVNPNAVEEYNEQKTRYDHYETQKQDLENAIDELKQAIAKINKTSKERFEETFNLVNHKFGEVIPLLFGGGSAQLILTEPTNPLESGLDIVIRPPGKKLTNVNLLSGGEKALASIGLIFSIFLIKPSPFCLLDEVDAPLDDANVTRFNKLVQQMANHSQVLLITHNKTTMEVADSLFGVTMQEKGVSKLVSVQFTNDGAAAN
ncbi:MAG: chromosome segregation protein SMC [Myxococcales bacterium]|nr:chromosome segregation protein SMC [Myxococcales bacterium]